MDRKGRTRRREWTAAPPSSEALLERVADFYHASLPDSTDAVSFLRGMGLDHAAVSESFCIGACDGSLSQTLPAGTPSDGTYLDPVHAGLRKLGVLDNEPSHAAKVNDKSANENCDVFLLRFILGIAMEVI